jgi:subtilase family serine protease
MLRYLLLFAVLLCLLSICQPFNINKFAGSGIHHIHSENRSPTNPLITKRIEPRVIIDDIRVPDSFYEIPGISQPRVLVVHIGLNKRNIEEMENLFWQVSDPKSSLYGKYLTTDEIAQKFGATKDSIEIVVNWLVENKVSHYEIALTKDLIRIEASVQVIENLFGTQMSSFINRDSGKEVISAVGLVSVPKSIAKHIRHISGLNYFADLQHYATSRPTPGKLLGEQALQQQQQSTNNFMDSPLSFFAIFSGLTDNTVSLYLFVNCQTNNSGVNLPLCNDVQILVIQYFIIGQNIPPLQTSISANSFFLFNSSGDINTYLAFANIEVTNYLPYNFSAYLSYSNSSSSSVIYAPAPIFATKITTPNNIATYYGTNYRRATNPRNKQAVSAFLQQYFSPTDLNIFLQYFGLPQANISKIIGYNNASNQGTEASLDVQYIMGVGLNMTTEFWSVNTSNIVGDMFTSYMYLISNTSDSEIPYVHSFSYGIFGIDNSSAQFLNEEFMKAGLRGITLLFASGDGGVGTRFAYQNTTFCQKFPSHFPSSSPYVTAVGATMWSTLYTPMCNQSLSCTEVKEITCMEDYGGLITTGGGFSEFFPMPSYQKNVVTSYLNNSNTAFPPSDAFNSAGRAYPDISVAGDNFVVIIGQYIYQVSGTSASTPTFAAMVSLLNDVRLNAGKPPLGFINPWLYQLYEQDPTLFNDIVVGNNRCGAGYAVNSYLQVPFCCPSGFNAAVGFDATTGLGSPRFDKIYEALVSQIEQTNQASNKSFMFCCIFSILALLLIL